MDYPWYFSKDMNYDGVFTITDVFKLIGQLVYLPGDSLIYFLINHVHGFSQFFELGPDYYGGFLSLIVSLTAWIIAILVCINAMKIYDETIDWVMELLRKAFPFLFKNL